MIISYNVALSSSMNVLLESVAKRKIIMPTSYHLMKTLDSRFNGMKSILKKRLSEQKYLCITADVWTSRSQSYLGVTVHFLNRETFKRESYLIGFRRLNGKQTYDELARRINDIFVDYGIRSEQLTNIVTDGGSNFCKMFKVFGKRLKTSTYINDEEDDTNPTHTDTAESDHSDLQFMEDATGELFAAEILDFGNQNDHSGNTSTDESTEEANGDYFGENIIPIDTCTLELPPQTRCISHKCNLLSDDFRKRLNGIAKTSLNAALEKLNTLWVLTHRSSQAKSICLSITKHCLPIPTETRWNSEFDAVKFCNRPDIINKLNPLIDELKDKLECQSARNLQKLSNHDMVVIQQYLNVMEPVACALDKMQREFNGSQGYILPVLHSMRHRVNQIDAKINLARDFKKAMLLAIDFRFNGYFEFTETNKDMLIASVTLPQIKTKYIERDDDIIHAKNLLLTECKKLQRESAEEQSNSTVQDDDDFLISFAEHHSHRRSSFENTIESEISRYLVDPRTHYSMLNDFPHVREMFFKYNTTLSSSAPIERVFSQSKLILTPQRNRISNDRFEKTLLLKHNRQLLQENNINIGH